MSNYNATILKIRGNDISDLIFLANIYYEPVDPDEIISMLVNLSIKKDISWKSFYRHETWFTSMDRSPAGHLFAVSMEGELHSNRSGTWEIIDLECPSGLNDIWVTSDNDAFAAGLKGEIVYLSGKSKKIFRDEQERRLNAVHGISNKEVFAVGDNGLIFQFNGTQWIEIEPPTNCNLLSVLCISKTEVYIGGTQGVLFKWNGKNFEWIESQSEITIYSLAWYQNELYAAGGLNGIYKLGDNGFEQIKDLIIYDLSIIDNFLFGVGNKLVIRYNGLEWRGGELNL